MLALATGMQLLVSFPQQTPAAIGPLLTSGLGLTRAELGLLTSAIWGGMLLGTLPWGMFVDRWGERTGVALGGALLAVCLLAAAQSASFLPLFLVLLLAAVGAGAGGVGGARALTAWFPPYRRGIALGIRQTGVTGAGLGAALLLPPIALRWGWPAALRTVAALVVVGIAAFVLLYREPDSTEPRRAGAFRLRDLTRNPTWLAATAFGWIFMGALGSAVTYLVAALHQDVGLSLVVAGYMLALLQAGGLAGRIGWGLLSDRMGRRGPVMVIAGGLGVLGYLALAGLDHRGVPIAALAPVALLLGLSCLGWNALYITLTAESVPPGFAATAIGAGTALTFTALFLVPPAFGLIADMTGTYTWSWLALGIWTAFGTIVGRSIRDRPISAA